MQKSITLPHEIQNEIISYIPKNEWFKLIGLDLLGSAFNDSTLWRTLNVDDFVSVTEESAVVIKKISKHVQRLIWCTATFNSGIDVSKLFQNFCNLLTLDLSNNELLKEVPALLSFSNITELSVRGCTGISRLTFLSIFQTVQRLEFLDVAHCVQLREKDIVWIAKKNKQLQYFNVRDSVSINYQVVLQIEQVLSSLKEFKFCAVVRRDDSAGWVQVYLRYPKLQICPAAFKIICDLNPAILQ